MSLGQWCSLLGFGWPCLVDFSGICFPKVPSSHLGRIISGQVWPHSKASQQEANWFSCHSTCHSHESQYNFPNFLSPGKGWDAVKNTNRTNQHLWQLGRILSVVSFLQKVTRKGRKAFCQPAQWAAGGVAPSGVRAGRRPCIPPPNSASWMSPVWALVLWQLLRCCWLYQASSDHFLVGRQKSESERLPSPKLR